MAQISLTVDARTVAAIDELKERFGVSTQAAVFRRALALARILARAADPDGAVTIINAAGERVRLILRG